MSKREEVTAEDGVYEADTTEVTEDGRRVALPVQRYALVKDRAGPCEHCGARMVETPHGPLVEYGLLELVANENDFLREQQRTFIEQVEELSDYIQANHPEAIRGGSAIETAIEVMKEQNRG